MDTTWEENTVSYSILQQVVWQEGLNHCFSIGRKHCNLQCFGERCVARRLEPLLKQVVWQEDPNHWQYGRETLYFTVFWGKLFSKGAQTDASKYVENIVFIMGLEPRVQHR